MRERETQRERDRETESGTEAERDEKASGKPTQHMIFTLAVLQAKEGQRERVKPLLAPVLIETLILK